ncbi:MAG: DUF6036 family nucleotidyltransferase [Dongiaceae bacterium]
MKLAERVVDIAVFGGAAMILSFPARPATKDIDAVALNDASALRSAVTQIAKEQNWPEDWLNDAVKGFLSARQADPDVLQLFRSYPSEDSPGLRVFVARPEYLLAMKCIAMRVDPKDLSQDINDIRRLIEALNLTTADQVLDIVRDYYPDRQIQPKTQFGVEEVMARLTSERRNDELG